MSSLHLTPAVANFRQRHPRWFLGGLCAAVMLPVVLVLNGDSEWIPSSGKFLGGHSYSAQSTEFYPALGPRSVAAAVERSEELWANLKAKRLEFIDWKGGLDNMRMFTQSGEPGYGQFYTVWDVYLPTFPCPWEVERIGRIVDGGKYTCGLPRISSQRGKDCVVYSFGVAQESSWEAELLERTECQIFMYDFSVEKAGPQIEWLNNSEMISRHHFFQYGIGSKDGTQFGKPFYTLRSLMRMNGHDWIDILKVDVEGAEFTVIPDIIDEFGENNLPFDQMLMEIHVNEVKPVGYDLKNFNIWWERMEEAGLRAFSSELNYPALHFTEYPQSMEMNYLNYGNRMRSKSRLLRD